MADGTRTHDDQNHNLGLYQLSYSHRRAHDCSVKNPAFDDLDPLRGLKVTFFQPATSGPGAVTPS